ncbi:glycosyltransferase family 4 protein [Pedobacter xixiisoli]|uniref:Glycosyltransferase involved in cell wall bisynthesis n=1 Tax=Pedobacter xixiisoli TaxID=1476464 RepID=A0A286A9P8_9SPHI|nr:glycosyltransferase family 4 protein [Pedobacter xixiisoli]SOD18612.1 Glycosyltransferase involved in cell wall bisynthesis [Pedobacter xixiisoli]
MKILTIVDNLGIGGTERAAQNYSTGYKKLGHDVKVLTLKGQGIRSEFLSNHDIGIYDGSKDLNKVLSDIRLWEPRIIHIHRSGSKCKATINIIKFLKTKQNRILETNVFGRPDYSADAVYIDVHLQLSRWCLWKWQQWTSKSKQIGNILPYPIDTLALSNNLSVEKKNFNLPEDSFILGRIGQPYDAKWHKIIFDVLSDLLNVEQTYYLVLVGLPPSLNKILSNYPKNVRDHIIVLPTTNSDKELAALYKSFDIFIHAAEIGESFGMVLAESLFYKTPVITLSTPLKDNTQLELIGDSKGGFVAKDKKDFIDKIIFLKNQPHLRKEFGINGHKFINNNFNIETITKRAIEIVQICLQSENTSSLKRNLNQAGFTTSVNSQDIYDIANTHNVSISPLKKIFINIIHQPLFFKIYLNSKKLLSFLSK